MALREASAKWLAEHASEMDALERAADDQQGWREERALQEYPPTYEEYMGLEAPSVKVQELRGNLEGRIRRSKVPTNFRDRSVSLDELMEQEESAAV